MNSTMRARISAGISMAMKMRMSHQLAADHVQCLLRGPLADAHSVAEEFSFEHVSLDAVGQRGVDQAHGLLLGPPARSGDSRDADAQRGFGALPDSFRKGHRHLAADRAVFFEDGCL